MPQTTDAIPTLLAECRTIAVVGLSAHSNRPSYQVAQYMQSHGYRIIPVNPTYAGTHILGEPCYATLVQANTALAEASIAIDLVNCFRKSDAIPPIADDAIMIGARCLWMQLGIMNEEAAAKARAAGLAVIMDRCIKIEHMRLPN